MIPVIYYMPIFLRRHGAAIDDSEILDFCELFKVFNSNACIVDRTGTIAAPFKTKILFPLPAPAPHASFEATCLQRARDILDEGKPIFVMYSGGLDSTTVMTAFEKVIADSGTQFSREQITVAASPDSVRENPRFWRECIMPGYTIMPVQSMLADIDPNSRYVQGENADQLFGSDRVFTEPWLMEAEYDADALKRLLTSRIERPAALDKHMDSFQRLAALCPLPVMYMRDFLWWINFTCKWQSVALRTLAFTNVFDSRLTMQGIRNFETFFNTPEFERLTISGALDKWGDKAGIYTYKMAARRFIAKYTGDEEYARTKAKVGSLAHVIRSKAYSAQAFGVDAEGFIQKVDWEQ